MIHQNKHALITGGTRGIGRAVAIKLASEGCHLILNYLDKSDAAKETLKLIQEVGGQATLVPANLRDKDEVKRLAKDVINQFSNIDYLIHCAALGSFKKTSEIKMNQWDLTMDINVKSLLLLCQQFKPHFNPGASIVALSSSGSTKVVPNYGAIGISKAALEALVRYLSVDYIDSGIRVNAVSGGFIDTQSLNAFPQYEEMKKQAIQRTPAKRIGQPDDLSGIVSFLCSDEAKWIVGQTILADGGLNLV